VGAHGSSGESQLQRRGYANVGGPKSDDRYRTRPNLSAADEIADLQADDVASSQLAVDCQIKQRADPADDCVIGLASSLTAILRTRLSTRYFHDGGTE